MSFTSEIKNTFRNGSTLIRLIYVNVGIFLLVGLPMTLMYLYNKNNDFSVWLSMPAYLGGLAAKPWTLITYMFFHTGIWHLLFNMLFLYWFGTIFMQFMNGKLLLKVYLLGGILGGIFFFAAYNIFPVFLTEYYRTGLLGASAAAMAVMIAATVLVPDFTVSLFLVWRVKLKYIALFLVVLDIMTIQQNENPGGHISHLGGALFGYIFMVLYKKQIDITTWMNPLIDLPARLFTRKPKMKVTYKRPVSDFEYNKQKNDDTKELDRILDKIKASGYDGLTKEEKDFLFRQSKK